MTMMMTGQWTMSKGHQGNMLVLTASYRSIPKASCEKPNKLAIGFIIDSKRDLCSSLTNSTFAYRFD